MFFFSFSYDNWLDEGKSLDGYEYVCRDAHELEVSMMSKREDTSRRKETDIIHNTSQD